MTSIINLNEYIFALAAGPSTELIDVIAGTTFAIGGDCFITAAHCVKTVFEYRWAGLLWSDGSRYSAISIDSNEYQCVDDYDVAVFRLSNSPPDLKMFSWSESELRMGTDVRSPGFPYALDLEAKRMSRRMFRGYVVAGVRQLSRLKADPPAYELSFPCPRGLSGAPLLLDDDFIVNGMIIANQSTEMIVLSSRERISEEKETIYEKVEALHLGIALQTRAIMQIGPLTVLGGRTIRDHLNAHGLLKHEVS